VRCTTTVTPATAFTLVRRTATGAGDSLHIVETLNATYAAGSAAVWTGPALVATRVQVFAMVPGERDTLADSTEFRPIPRTWEPYRITDSRVDTAVDTRGGMRPWPTDGTAIGTWYLYALQITSTPVFRADDGPNRGVAVFAERPDFEDPHITHIYLHPAIFTPETSNLYQRWYRQQDGRPEGTCDQQQMLQLRAEELRHEGVTYAPDSHNGIAQAWLDREKWQKYFESQRVVDMDESALRENAVYRWTASGEQMYNAQYAFDAQEYQLIYVDRLKCLLDPGVK
jgi:hypothetical protein